MAALAGSGPAGVVLRRDVEAALLPHDHVTGEEEAGPCGSAARSPPVRRRKADPQPQGDPRRHGLGGRRRHRTGRGARRAPGANPDRPVGLLALLARFVVAGLRRYPELNARVDGAEIVRLPDVNLGFAAQTERGLVVPVVRNAHRMTTLELGAEIERLTVLARTGTLHPTDLTGGTITLNNYGVFGVDGSTPIINYPESALVGIGRIVDKPWVVEGELAVRKVTQLSLTFDHRVCDGGTAGGFLRYVADCVERPVGLLADL